MCRWNGPEKWKLRRWGSRLLGFQVVGLDPASGEPTVSYITYLLLAQTASLASTPQVEESIVSFAGIAPNELLLYYQSREFVARFLILQITVHDIAINLSAELAVLLMDKTHLCLDTGQSEFGMVFEIPATQCL